jgi:hypothetical protein
MTVGNRRARLGSFMEHRFFVTIIFYIPVCSAYLVTNGSLLLNASTSDRVRLHCVNWYGAHQEPLIPGGLEVASTDQIADLIVKTGANCVRLPLSDLAVLDDPTVQPIFCRGQNLTAMQVLDLVIESLTSRGLMVILNSHTSRPGWVGLDGTFEEAPQGLWHGPEFSTADWVRALSSVAARYADNTLVVGIDLRNEIHDQNRIIITWGESSDVDSDWLAAATLAERAISIVNPNVLIIVTGLCRAYDLRQMVKRPGPTAALLRKKLVYTTHVYTFSWWWTQINLLPAFETTLVVLIISGGSMMYLLTHRKLGSRDLRVYSRMFNGTALTESYSRKEYYKREAMIGSASFFPFACLWVAVAYVKAKIARMLGCETIAIESDPWLYIGVSLLIPSAIGLFLCCKSMVHGTEEILWHMVAWMLFWICLTCIAICAFYFAAGTYWMVIEDVSRWVLDDRTIPVWVGEFGTIVGDDSWKWGFLMRVLKEYDLDFAYWAINGRKWRHGAWESEEYGLITEDYRSIRNKSFTDSIFNL